ncbi:tryptophan halogenase [Pseudoalteromonas sp. NBT06-2]|uniref:tryptophan halogenase family protein n=1 Tax=Pseudoalteromonas sp. NBT06-2 TaxID=2025950 RepID=UPI000BA65185|nr:tryptophan halogenase family protein [Pseudoalteromonas sp. NBT06-2]PAJ72061.1 tryptophan halogenase [Pseudoalteromonas sp. NBT06-2]
MNKPIKNIVIVGGGSAGWITAGLLAAEHKTNNDNAITITLIESPEIKTIGVGEGTWPSMRNTLDKIGIKESEFIAQCNASFKQGSKFVNWQGIQNNDIYYHPFMTPEGYTQVNLHHGWQHSNSNKSFADTINMQSHICHRGLAPKQASTPEYASVTNYGYHLDAGKFSHMLQTHCTKVLGVKHVIAHINQIHNDENDYITHIEISPKGRISGDLFIDCSGLNALLIDKHYKIPFIDKNHILFNDSALAVQAPYCDPDEDIASATVSTAQSAGWVWDIGLSNRRGIGYTYSSKHTCDTEAEKTLKAYLSETINDQKIQNLNIRKLNFKPGHREKFWHKNCIAVGMSSGFLEPLEASSLALVELSANMISEELPANFEHMNIIAKRFNERFEYRWQRVIEFLKLHYVISKRTDSQYWLDNKTPESIPKRLKELLTLWQYQPPNINDFVQNQEVFPSASYQYVIYGMGFNTTAYPTDKAFNNIALAQRYFAHNQETKLKYLNALPSNRELLNHIKNNCLQNTG